MKILLINPPQIAFPGSERAEPISAGLPLGLLYIGATLDKKGYKVEILDTLIANFPPQKIGDITYYGMPWEKIKDKIMQSKPDVVGITNPFITQIDNAIKVSEIVKNMDAEIPTIVGGPHISVTATQFLNDAKNVDIAVIGEGEYTILDIMKYYQGEGDIGQIPGIAYRRDDAIKLSPQRSHIKILDELPFPAYHLVEMERYLNPERIRYRNTKNLREIPMITSRGCPYNCIFCSIHLCMGKTWRSHSKEYVLKHIEHVVNAYNVEHIHFEDDNFTLDKKRFESILDDLIERDIKFSWDTPNGIRAEGLTLNLLKKMIRTGCTDLTIGVESGDQSILDNVIDKDLLLEDVIKTAKMCKELNIPLSAFFVIGFPGEKKENMKKTIDFALMLQREYDVQMSLMAATPLYGTKLYKICKENGYLACDLTPRAFSERIQYYGAGMIRTEDFTPEDIKKLCLDAYRSWIILYLFEHITDPKVLKKAMRKPYLSIRLIKNYLRKS
jgi:anaerobic magnesium-protoporphyrin IX monomethyl ester cyclase